MAKLARKLQKIFGNDGPVGEFGKIGSDNLGLPVTTKDLDVIQELQNYLDGLFAITNNAAEPPRAEDFNSLHFMQTTQAKYMFQSGIPEWLTTEEYYGNFSIVQVAGKVYVSRTGTDLSPNLGNNPVSDTTNWRNIGDKDKLWIDGTDLIFQNTDMSKIIAKSTAANSNAGIQVENDVQQWILYIASSDSFQLLDNTNSKTPIRVIPNAFSDSFLITTNSVIINQNGDVLSFRVEGDTDENLIITDATNNRVGVGVAVPLQKLDVNGNINLPNTNGIYVNNQKVFWKSTTTTYVDNPLDNSIQLRVNTAATPKNIVTITSNERVGISESAPEAKLHITDSASLINSLIIENTNAAPSGGSHIVGRASEGVAAPGDPGDLLLGIRAAGAHVADTYAGYNADICFEVGAGTYSSTSYPGRLSLRTTSDGSLIPAVRMQINSDGAVLVFGPINSTSKDTGQLRLISGGMGVEQDISAGGIVRADGGFEIEYRDKTGAESKKTTKRKRLQIVNWNMDSSGNVGVNFGSITNWRSIVVLGVMIKNDANDKIYPLNRFDNAADPTLLAGGVREIDSVFIYLYRRTGGFFDGSAFDDPIADRGFIDIEYEA